MLPNVVLVVLDTARADAFSPYGATSNATPAIAELADRGGAMAGVAASSWTLPSHAAMFTGALPRSLGLGQAPAGPRGCRPLVEALEPRFLPSVLSRAGYVTRGISANAWISEASGFATGFDEFRSHVLNRAAAFHSGIPGSRARWLLSALRARVDDGAAEVAEHLRNGLAGHDRSRPFFWFVNLVECHSPYLPPRPYNDLGPVQRLRAAEEARRHLTLEGIWRACASDDPVDPAVLARMKQLYDGSIRQLDAWVATLLEDIDANGMLDDTIIIITSDHGENFGEGGLLGHAFSLDDRLIKVPLVVAGPGVKIRPGLVSQLDLPAMLASWLGIAHPWNAQPRHNGTVVAQFDPLVKPDDPRLEKLVVDWHLDDEARRLFTDPLTCATDGATKLIQHGDRRFLIDLHENKSERLAEPVQGLVPDHLAGALNDPQVWVDGHTWTDVEPHDDDAELRQQMRLLGYM